MSKLTNLPPSDIQFGHKLLPYFALDPNYKMVNAGAYGVTPNYVLEAKKNYYREIEKNPDLFFRTKHLKTIQERKDIVAKYLNVSSTDIVLVDNATEAINSVLKSIAYQAGDIILIYDVAYKMVEEVCTFLAEKYGLKLVIIPTSNEILNSKEKLVGLAEEYISKYSNQIKIAVIDHITSAPSLIFPVKELIPLFRKNNILCLIDGAQALGQIDVNITDLDPGIRKVLQSIIC